MTKKFKRLGLIILIFSAILSGCSNNSNINNLETQLTEKAKEIETLISENNSLIKTQENLEKQVKEFKEKISTGPDNSESPQLGPSQNVLSTSLEVMELIKANDMASLSNYVHPSQGLRFTPYFYIDTQNNQIFTAQEISTISQNTTVFNWGDYDGRGDPINLNFNDYYDEFIYDADFISPHLIGNNVPIGSGNTTDNIDQAYPNGHFIEFHFTGFDPQFTGIDWKSLRLVFEQDNGIWYLVGIVHGQWTI